MGRCPNCRRTLAVCLCASITLEMVVSDAQAWCSLPPAAASARTFGKAAKPAAEFREVATTQPGIRRLLLPDQLSPAQAMRDRFLQKAQVAALIGVCAGVAILWCVP